MKVTRYPISDIQVSGALAYLMQNEAMHNLMIGLLKHSTEFNKPDAYISVIHDDEVVLGVSLRTPPYNLAISDVAHLDVLDLFVKDVMDFYGDRMPGVLANNAVAQAFAEKWCARTEQIWQVEFNERIYQLTSVILPKDSIGHLRQMTLEDQDLAVQWLKAFQKEALPENDHTEMLLYFSDMLEPQHPRTLYFWEIDAQPVCMVGISGKTPNGARVGPVYTPREFRGQGYGSAATAALSQLLLDQGCKFCFLYTDLSNPTSNKIYQNIGYQPICDVQMIMFKDMST